MRVLSVTQSYYPFLESGGPAFKVRAIAKGLAQRGHQVTVLTSDLGVERFASGSNSFVRDRWGWQSREDSIEMIYLRSRARYRALTWNPGIFRFCREHLASFDIVHIYGLYDLLGPAVARACIRRQVPYVVEPMGMFRPIVRNIPLKRVYRRVWGDSMARSAQRLVVTSDQEQKELIEEGIPAEKIVVRRNGVEPPEPLPAWGAFRQRWHIPDEALVVLFLGRLVSKKSPELLLDAFARWDARSESSKPAILVFVGPDEGDGYRAKLEAGATRLKLRNGVLFTGPLYGDAKWSAFRDADVFVLPSQNENFGNTAAESVACGTPVLLTDRCGIAPLVEGRAGIVVAHELEALAAALDHILGNEGLREKLKKGCAEIARELSWKEPLDETEGLYRALVRNA